MRVQPPGPFGPGRFGGGGIHHGGGLSIAAFIVHSILIAAVIVAAFLLVRALIRGRDRRIAATVGPHRSPALDELDLLYARGQVPREEYLGRRADLLGTTSGYGAPPVAAPPPAAPAPPPAPTT